MQNSIKNLVALLIAVLAGTGWTVNSYLESRHSNGAEVVRNARLLDIVCSDNPALEICACEEGEATEAEDEAGLSAGKSSAPKAAGLQARKASI